METVSRVVLQHFVMATIGVLQLGADKKRTVKCGGRETRSLILPPPPCDRLFEFVFFCICVIVVVFESVRLELPSFAYSSVWPWIEPNFPDNHNCISVFVFYVSLNLYLCLYLHLRAWDSSSVWPWPQPNFPDNHNCPSRLCPQAESLWDITYDAIHGGSKSPP